MTRLIAETAWHHQGDFSFMCDLVGAICAQTDADVVKMHITIDLDEYMDASHEAYQVLKSWMLTPKQWDELIHMVQDSGKSLMLLLNDSKAMQFAADYNPELVELHSVCLNVPDLQQTMLDHFDRQITFVVGVGGCSVEEVDSAVAAFAERNTVLMFGFQNYPTKYEDINLHKIRRLQSAYAGKLFGYADHTAWNEPNNALISLLVAANGMDFVEKHVTTRYGEERCDYNAAISISMFNQLAMQLRLLNQLNGDGGLMLNDGERAYSQFGPMKMAALATQNLAAGHVLTDEDIRFCRTGEGTNLSQLDAVRLIGDTVEHSIKQGAVLVREDFPR